MYMIIMMIKMIMYMCRDDDDDHNDSLKLEKLGVVLSSYYRPPLKCVLCVLLVQSSGKYCAALKQQFDSTFVQQTVALCTINKKYSTMDGTMVTLVIVILGHGPATRS